MGNRSAKASQLEREILPIVWLDGSVNKSQMNIDAQIQLRATFHDLRTFEEETSCELHLQSTSSPTAVVLIVSGRLGEPFVPKIHRCTHISAVYIFCMNDEKHKIWARNFYKVRGVSTDLKDLIACIQTDRVQHKEAVSQTEFSFSICRTSTDLLDWFRTPNDDFLYSYVCVRSMLRLDAINRSKARFALNSTDAKVIDEFKATYSSDKAVWWWTRHYSAISTLLKRALRHREIDLLLPLRFWLRDIELQLSATRLNTSVRVYRSLWLRHDQLVRLQNAPNHYLMVHDFLSTTSDRNLALWLLDRAETSAGTERILLQIDADSALPGTSGFSQVRSINNSSQEEIIFSLDSIFQLVDLDQDDDHRWTLHLILCSPDEVRIDRVLHYLSDGCDEPKDSPLLLASALQNLNQHDRAMHYYQQLIEILPLSEHDANKIQKLLRDQQEEQQCLSKWIHPSKSGAVSPEQQRTFNEARQYERMARFYRQTENLDDAIKTYDLAIRTWKKIIDENHSQLAMCWYEIASIYDMNKEFTIALRFYRTALNILETSFSAHRDRVMNIGNRMIDIYRSTGDFDAALEFNERLQNLNEKQFVAHRQ